MTRVSLSRLIAIVAISFGLTLVTSTLEPALLGHKILALIPNRGIHTAVFGAVTFGGLVVAILAQPLIGAWSDHIRSPLGRRVPFMLAGAAGVVLGLLLIAGANSLPVLVGGLLVTQLGLNGVLASWQPAIAERIPQPQRGLASGIKAGWDLLAAIVGRVAAAELISLAEGCASPACADAILLAVVAVPIAGLLIMLTITLCAMRRTVRRTMRRTVRRAMRLQPVLDVSDRAEPLSRVLRWAFTVDVRSYPVFGWWFVNRMLFWAGMIGSSVFLLFVAVDVFGMAEAEAQRMISRVIIALGIALALVIVPAGWLADRLGRRPLIIAAGLAAALGALVVVADYTLILPAAILIGAGTGVYLSSSLALINDIVPPASAARYLGVANIATAGGSAMARLGGGVTISVLNGMTGSSVAGYQGLYAICAALFLLSAVVMALAPRLPASYWTSSPNPARASATATD